jgi:hypothetical protein
MNQNYPAPVNPFTQDFCAALFLLAESVSGKPDSLAGQAGRQVMIDRLTAWLNAGALASGAPQLVQSENCVSGMVH